MKFNDFLNAVINQGKEQVKAYYPDEEKSKLAIVGSNKGLEDCRGKTQKELEQLIKDSRASANASVGRMEDGAIAWEKRSEMVQWVCRVVSGGLEGSRMPVILHPYGIHNTLAVRLLGGEKVE